MIFAGLADDITGGMELAAVLAGQGVDCSFVTNPDRVQLNREAVVIAQKTRTCAPRDALRMTACGLRAAMRANAAQIFFKYCATFDSTAKGNIGPCADFIARELGVDFTLFVPSFPEAERYVFQGHLFVQDRLVSESPKRFDPLTPMTDPDLVRVLQAQTAVVVGRLPLSILHRGPAAAEVHLTALRHDGVGYAIADAISNDDLAALAELTAEWRFMTGNSTIAGFYPPIWRRQGLIPPDRGPPSLPPIDGPAVVLAGSCADRTLEQLVAFEHHRPVIRIDPLEAAQRDLVPELFAQVQARLADGPIAIASSARPADVKNVQDKLGVTGAAATIEDLLGRLASQLRRAGVRRFLVAGGETSGAILDHLGIESMQVGRYEAAGVGRAVSEQENPIALCLKSGKLGPVDMFLPTLEAMRRGGS